MSKHRPVGAVRHAAGMLTPTAALFGRVGLERQAATRARRLADAAWDRFAQRRRPTRPRMRALTVGPGGRFEWREAPAPPSPGPEGAVVHPIAAATCDLDRVLALGRTPFPLPLHFGHECVAEVLSVGERVSSVTPGDRVVVPFQINCGHCAPCRAGHTGNCASVPPISMYGFGVGGGHWGGVMSDRLAVPFADAMLVPLPDGIEPAAAASVADNVADAYRHIAPHIDLLREPDAEVLMLAGIGRKPVVSSSVPLYAGLVAKALGVETVHLVDSREQVRAHAERLGLIAHPPSQLRRLPVAALVVDGTATASGMRASIEHTAPDGVCSSLGGLHRFARLPTGVMFGRNVTFKVARSHARALIPHVLELMGTGKLHPEHVTTELEKMDEAPRAIERHVRGDATKTILVQ